MSKKSSLYRFFDTRGNLLYVGATSNPFRRMAEHSGSKPFSEVASVTLEWFETRRDAMVAEASAIQHENPLWNIASMCPAKRYEKKAIDGRGRPSKFNPTPEDDKYLRTLWRDQTFSQAYVLRKAAEKTGQPVKRHQLIYRYGNREK